MMLKKYFCQKQLLFSLSHFLLILDFVLCLTFCHFVLVFRVLLALRLPRLGKREQILVLFVRLFDFCLFGFVGFLFFLVMGRAAVCDLRFVALPGFFTYLFLYALR